VFEVEHDSDTFFTKAEHTPNSFLLFNRYGALKPDFLPQKLNGIVHRWFSLLLRSRGKGIFPKNALFALNWRNRKAMQIACFGLLSYILREKTHTKPFT